MKRRACVVALLFFYVSCAHAWFEEPTAGQPGGYLSELSGGARGLALGLAQVSLDGQANLLYSNPASISSVWWKEASFDFLPLFDQSQFASLSFASPVGNGNTLGISLLRLDSGDAEKTDALGQTIGTFSDQETALIAGIGRNISEKISLGVSIKMVSQAVDTLSEQGFGADIGVIYHYLPGHTWGLCLQNVIAPVLGPDRFPLTLNGGFSHAIFNNFTWHGQVSVLDILNNEPVVSWYSGFEYNRPDWFFWRLGVNKQQFSAGFGIGTKQIDIDYAFVYHPLGTLNSISLNLRYGYPTTDAELRAAQKIQELKNEKAEYLETVKKENENIKFERERLEKEKKTAIMFIAARKAFEDKKYAAAQLKIQEILKIDPAYEEAIALKKEINARLNSDNLGRRLEYARLAYKQGLFKESKEHLNFVLGMQPDNMEGRVLDFLVNAQIYLMNKQFNEAKGELIEVLKIEPNNTEASQLLKRVQNIIDIYGGQ